MTTTSAAPPTPTPAKPAHATGAPPSKDAPPKLTYRKDYRPSAFTIAHAELSVKLDPVSTTVFSTLRMSRRNAGSDPLVLDGEALVIEEVEVDGRKLEKEEFELEDSGCLRLPAKLLPKDANRHFTVTTRVKVSPESNLQLMGLFVSQGIICSQCEAHGFRRITPFLDRPDVMATYCVRLEADKAKYPVLLCNGNKIASGDIEDGRHFAVFDDPVPKPSYLFAILAGDLARITDSHTTRPSGRRVEINVWSHQSAKAKLGWAMECVKKAFVWDEDSFGREYDLETFHVACVSHFNMGAMENKGLNIFNSAALLASPDTSTDRDYERILGVVGHEYFHNWTGNRITCRDWFQLTLKEGLTVFREEEFSADSLSRGIRRVDAAQRVRSLQFKEDAGPLAHPIRPEAYLVMDNFYTPTVYDKGSEVIRMYHTLLGRGGFRRGMDLYFERHDGQAVTCDDFRAAMADANGKDLTQFELWYSQAGTPVVTVDRCEWNQAANELHLRLRQRTAATPGQPEKLPLHVPVRVGVIGRNSKKDIVPERVLELTTEVEDFVIPRVTEPPVPSILRDFSAPVMLCYEESSEDLAFRLAFDCDPYNRFEAGQMLTAKRILEIYRGDAAPMPTALSAAFLQALRTAESAEDQAFMTECLRVADSEATARLLMGEAIDPLKMFAARSTLKKQIAEARFSEFRRVYDAMTQMRAKTYQPIQGQFGVRRLRNLCLQYMGVTQSKEIATLAWEQFESSDNMTDRVAAAQVLMDYPLDTPERIKCLESFFVAARSDDLVMNKWLALQALADVPEAAEEVRRLQTLPEFDRVSPNAVRALIGGFSMNMRSFHAADGSGYSLLADAVLGCDSFNAHIAAALAKILTQYRRWISPHCDLMLKELRRISETPGLSPNTFEIVHCALKATTK